jgi:hypothetical protein
VSKATWDTHDLLFAETVDKAVTNAEACRVAVGHGERHIQWWNSAVRTLEKALILEVVDTLLVKFIHSALLLLGTRLMAVAIAVPGSGNSAGLLGRVSRTEVLPDKGRITEWIGGLADSNFNVLDNFLGMDTSLLKHQWGNGLIVVEHRNVCRT